MKSLTLAAGCLTGLVFLTGCGNERTVNNFDKVHIAELEAQVADQKAMLASKDAEIANLKGQMTVQPVADNSLDDVKGDLAGSGANVRWRNGELVISITNDILFGSGSATLTSKAKSSLRKVADTVRSRYPGQYVRIEGHTDNQPIRRTRNKWEDNWHLAGARARSVLHELVDKGGMTRDQISFAGYADTRSRASNGTASGRSENRRVEIVVLPAEQP